MITTVTLNPMLDKTVYVDRIQRGKVQRAAKVEMVVGGKGINVSRQLSRLGMQTVATGFIGGEIGSLIERLLDEEGIAHEFVHVRGMTREGVTYREHDNIMTAIFEPSHGVTRQEADMLRERVKTLTSRSDWVVCSGSSPSAEADDVFAGIVRDAHEHSVPTVVDSYGTVCRNAAKQGPTILKMNNEELQQTIDRDISEDGEFHRVFDQFLQFGSFCCILTDGPRACYAATQNKRWKITPPAVAAVNPTGSGDSMLAGILYAYSDTQDMERALRFGSAAGAANAQRWEVSCSSLEDISRLESQVIIETL